MRPAYGPDIGIVASTEPFESLMNDHIVYKEVCKSISHNSKPNRMQPPHARGLHPIHDAKHAGDGKNDEESIVLFKEPRLYLMMVLVQIPEKSMHHPTMCTPCDAFHQ
jgi:hypothetical protein